MSRTLIQAAQDTLSSAPGASLPAPPGDAARPGRAQLIAIIVSVAQQEHINPQLAVALAQAESSLDPRAVSSAGAVGLMQMLPATARRFGVSDIWDPEQNARGGLRYLKFLLAIFDGDLRLALAAYNAGIPSVLYYEDVPPFGETRAFVGKVLRTFSERMLDDEG